MGSAEKLVDIVKEFISVVETVLPIDMAKAIKRLSEVEEGLAKEIAISMIKNLEVAEKRGIPICQDTGMLMFFIKLGLGNPLAKVIDKVIVEAVEKATRDIPLRPNAINPFTGINSGNNIGRYTPWIMYDSIDSSDIIDVWLYIAGGGSSYASEAKVLNPSSWREQLVELVLSRALSHGVNACPPLLVGIGIGPTIDIASVLSKKALLRDIGKRHEESFVAELEEEIKNKLNSLGLGPQGLRGRVFVVDVFIEYAYVHPASVAVAVSFNCWVHRKGRLRIYPDLSYEIPTHGIERRSYG